MQRSLTVQQQDNLQKFKMDTRLENERFLRERPEIQEIIQQFLLVALEYKPEDPIQFAAAYFSQRPLPRSA